jgi:hypothetical protein
MNINRSFYRELVLHFVLSSKVVQERSRCIKKIHIQLIEQSCMLKEYHVIIEFFSGKPWYIICFNRREHRQYSDGPNDEHDNKSLS